MNAGELHCEHCGEPIGVYEPIVVFDGLNAHLTSRGAAGPDGLAEYACYHAECFHADTENGRANGDGR